MAHKVVRSPFVVTVALMASAALPACGGQVSPNPAADGGAADGELAKTCPTERPATGGVCRVDPSRWCEYGTCGAGAYPVTMRCVPLEGTSTETATWQEISGTSCNPPPPECPPWPYEGAPCKPSWGSESECFYPDHCAERPADAPATRAWSCVGDKLVSRDTTSDYVVACPAVAPKHGDGCACGGHYAGDCTYGDCAGRPTTTARCDEKALTWSVAVTSCNPPPPDAGP